MNTFKKAITAAALFLVFSSTVFASNNPITSVSSSLRSELTKLVQSPGLVNQAVSEASIDVRFKIDSAGQINVLSSSSRTPFLINFIEENLSGHSIRATDYIPEATYKVRFKFELE